MDSNGTCRECGTAIPAGSPGGFCAQCLLRLGLETVDRGDEGMVEPNPPEEQPRSNESKPPSSDQDHNSLRASVPLSEKPGDRIGRYRLLKEIGHGGCGVVYMAEQEEPVRRKVALKVIKLGMDTRQVVARFEAERQALAMMDHPNIARVLDAGATDTGRPYFVMELVGGVKITDYCAQNQLTTRQRLDLFIQVCRAVQHAHQKGIIHRDIKPSNVLVSIQDGASVPKVIDFGIAKATQGRLTDQTVFTAFEQFLGTPAYMSPEQAQAGGLDVDTRSDIYSLGVLLYELLTGKTPFDSKELLVAGLDAMRRIILEKEPPTPSTRLAQELAPTYSAIADKSEIANRKSEIDKDLDWIVMKCLEKDRARRYETANGLAMDIERHLSNELVIARPPSRLYRFQKAIRRNKSTFIMGSAFAAVLVCGAVVSVWQAVRATRAKAQVLAQKQRADEEAAKQEAINALLNEILASADPYELAPGNQTKGQNITMLQVVDAAAGKVQGGSLTNRPAIEAAICQTLGRTYLSLHEPSKAEPLLKKALEDNRRIYGEQSENAVTSLEDLLGVLSQRGQLDQASKMEEEILVMEKKLHGNEHLHVAKALLRMANTSDAKARSYNDSQAAAEAERGYREALAMERRLLPPESPELIGALQSSGRYFLWRNPVEAERMLQEALRIQTNVGGIKHPGTASIMNSLASVLFSKRDYAQAENVCVEVVALNREFLGTNHFALASSLGTLGDVLQREQKFAEAEAAYREGLAILCRHSPDGGDAAWFRKILAENLISQKRFLEAATFYRQVLEYWEGGTRARGAGESYWQHLNALLNVLKAANKPDEVEKLLQQILDRQRKTLGDTHPIVPAILCLLGDLLNSREQRDRANELYRQARELIPKLGPARNRPATLSLARSLCLNGNSSDAQKLYERLLEVESQNQEKPNLFMGELLQDFGDLLGGERRFPAAAEQFRKALPLRRPSDGDNLNWTLRSLGFALYMSAKPMEAERYVRESLKHYRSLHQGDDLNGTTWPTKLLADILLAQGKLPEAEQMYREALKSYLAFNDLMSVDYTVQTLVEVLVSEKKLTGAESMLIENLAWQREKFGQKSLKTVPRLLGLAQCLKLDSKPDKAADLNREVVALLAGSRKEALLDLPPNTVAELIAAGLNDQARGVCAQVLALTPTNASWCKDAAWGVIMAEHPCNEDAALALQLAHKAVEINPQDHLAQIVLGAAQYRAGDWQGAISNLEKAAPLYSDNEPRGGLFFLAMAQLRLADPLAARCNYSQAVNWMAEHTPADKELLRLRAETEALLGHDHDSQVNRTQLSR